jgi:hypothetical protein
MDKTTIGLIWFPSARATAYLNILRNMKLAVNVIVIMKNPKGIVEGLVEEAQLNDYANLYFDPGYELAQYVKEFNVQTISTDASNINDKSLSEVIFKHPCQDWIFTGGGILKPNLFEHNNRYIHVHPGKLPEYRGSTCFYYSLLDNMSLASTAFFMSSRLDDGIDLHCTKFSVNLQITENMPLFFDYILDPWIRAVTLRKVLGDYLRGQCKPMDKKPTLSNRTYYVIHPILRNLTIKKINALFDPNAKRGIIECV